MLQVHVLKSEINKVDLYNVVKSAFVGTFINGLDTVGVKETEQSFHFVRHDGYEPGFIKVFNYKIFTDLGEAVTYAFKKYNKMSW